MFGHRVIGTTMSIATEDTIFPTRFGWVGLGAMGYPMAVQLRRKIPQTASFYIFDLDKPALERFVHETAGFGTVTIANSSKEVAEHSVSSFYNCPVISKIFKCIRRNVSLPWCQKVSRYQSHFYSSRIIDHRCTRQIRLFPTRDRSTGRGYCKQVVH